MAGTTISGLTLAVPGAAKGALAASDLTSKLLNQAQAFATTQGLLGSADLKKSLLEQRTAQGFVSQNVANLVGQPDLASPVSISDAINRGITAETQAEQEKQAGLDALTQSKFLKLKLAEETAAADDGVRLLSDQELLAQALTEATAQSKELKLPLPTGISAEDLNKSVIKNVSEGLGLSVAEVRALQKQETRSALGNLSLTERTLINSLQRQGAAATAAATRVTTRRVEKTAADIAREQRDIQSDVDSFLANLARDGRKAFRSGRRDINVQRANNLIQRMIDSGQTDKALRFKENFEGAAGGKATLQEIPGAAPVPPAPARAIPPPRQAPRQQQVTPQPPPDQGLNLTPEETTKRISGNITRQKLPTITRLELEDLIIKGVRGPVGAPSRATIEKIISDVIKNTGVRVTE